MITRILLILIIAFTSSVFAIVKSSYYKKGNNWQESVASSIQKFHIDWGNLKNLLNDESSVKPGFWYSAGPFPGEGNELFKKQFGPEKNPGLNEIYNSGLKWNARHGDIDGQLHNFPGDAKEVTYLQRNIEVSNDMEILAYVSSDDGLHFWLNGKLIFENDADRGLEPNQEYITLQLEKGSNTVMMKINNRGGLQGYSFSLLPDEDVYRKEITKIWTHVKNDFPDATSNFQIERELTDEIWLDQIKGYDESILIENYLKKIQRIHSISKYGKKYIKSVGNETDLKIIRELYYLSCKFDNILYLDDAHEKDDETWNSYKAGFKVKAEKVASLLTSGNGNDSKLLQAGTELDEIFSKIPLKLPSGPRSKGKFGAYYTTLKYDLEWDKHWRIGDNADVVINFPDADYKFVFWRGTSYIPCWVTDTEIWYTNEFVERRGFHNSNTVGCVEPMSDKQCRYSHVRIIENNDARVVVHWRYAPVDVNYEQPFTDPVTGWSDWVDEVYTIYPSGIGIREITVQTNRPDLWTEFQEMIVINQPGTMPEDNIDLGAVSLANMKGEKKTFFWDENGGPEFDDGPKHASIFKINLKAEHSPFALVQPPTEDGSLITSYLGHAPTSKFNFWDHWPVSQDASDGRTATSADRPSHSSLGHVGLPGMADMEWKPYKAEGIKRTKLLLHGMTDNAVEDLVPIAKSWLYSAEIEMIEGCESAEYDPTQLCYNIKANDSKVVVTLMGSKDSPIVNPAFVLSNWMGSASVTINGVKITGKKNLKIGNPKGVIDKDLVVWVEYQSESETEFIFEMEK